MNNALLILDLSSLALMCDIYDIITSPISHDLNNSYLLLHHGYNNK